MYSLMPNHAYERDNLKEGSESHFERLIVREEERNLYRPDWERHVKGKSDARCLL